MLGVSEKFCSFSEVLGVNSYICCSFIHALSVSGKKLAYFVRCLCYNENWRSFRKVLGVKCYFDCRFARALCVNKSKVEAS